MQAKDNVYDPYWEFEDLEQLRLKEVAKRAVNKVGPEGNEKHEEGVRVEEKGETSILCIDQQKEKRVRKVARVRWVLGEDGKYHKKHKIKGGK